MTAPTTSISTCHFGSPAITRRSSGLCLWPGNCFFLYVGGSKDRNRKDKGNDPPEDVGPQERVTNAQRIKASFGYIVKPNPWTPTPTLTSCRRGLRRCSWTREI